MLLPYTLLKLHSMNLPKQNHPTSRNVQDYYERPCCVYCVETTLSVKLGLGRSKTCKPSEVSNIKMMFALVYEVKYDSTDQSFLQIFFQVQSIFTFFQF